uniref:Zona pellucida sperm-binding protein 3 n=1 Tax=Erpetoichthys calabaricus TaxID=27687 RepID=A0A8C4RTE2_ERPCA
MVFGMGALCFFCCLLGGFPLLGLTSPIDDFQADKWDYNTPSRKIAKHGLGAARPKLFMPAKGIPFIISPFPESLLDPRVLTGPSAKLPPALKALLNPTPPRPVVTLPVIPKSDVSLACSISKMMVRVKKAFFGFGYTEAELVLGNKCKSNGKDEATGDLLFNYPLNACDGKRSTHEGCLTYENVLHFKPHIVPGVIRRKQPVNVALKCCYFRYYHVYKAAVHPTWSAPSGLKTLHHPSGMVLKLMDATFSKPFEAKEYHLGQEIHFQAVSYPNSTRQWLFLHSCFATPTPNPNSSPRYTVIDNYGCMVDSKQESCSSRFERPRMANVVSFTVSAFQFNDHKQVYFHCKMFTKKSQDVTNTAKFCTYNKKLSRWQELGGHDRVCECCDSVCGPSEYDEVTESNGPVVVVGHDGHPGAGEGHHGGRHPGAGEGHHGGRHPGAGEGHHGGRHPGAGEGHHGGRHPGAGEGHHGGRHPGAGEGHHGGRHPGAGEGHHGGRHPGAGEGHHGGRHPGAGEGHHGGRHPGAGEGHHGGRHPGAGEGHHGGRHPGAGEGHHGGRHPGAGEGHHGGRHPGAGEGHHGGRHPGAGEGHHGGRHPGAGEGHHGGRHPGAGEGSKGYLQFY